MLEIPVLKILYSLNQDTQDRSLSHPPLATLLPRSDLSHIPRDMVYKIPFLLQNSLKIKPKSAKNNHPQIPNLTQPQKL